MNHEFYMDLAIKQAWKYQILTFPNPAVGCCLVDKNGAILEVCAHQKAGSFHAELGAIRSALSKHLKVEISEDPMQAYEFIMANHANFFKDATLYVTLEPCSHFGKTPSCADIISKLGFKKVFVAVKDENEIASNGAKTLQNADIEVEFGILQAQALELIEPFKKWQNGNFSFLKLALSQNGSFEGKITNMQSQEFCHKLRDKIELLVIGGNTVRIDKPTLDTRYLQNGKNSDVLIYSKSDDFNRQISLFKVPDRRVNISNSLKSAFETKLTMFEGAQNFLEILQDRVDWFLIFHSSEFKNAQNLKLDLKLKPLYIGQFGDNIYGWYKRA